LRDPSTWRIDNVQFLGRVRSRRGIHYFLNAHRDERFARCARCHATTRLRKIPLVIHVDSFGLELLRKICRLCVACEMLIAHEFELNGKFNKGSLGRRR
jgi:ribosomal protein S27AE